MNIGIVTCYSGSYERLMRHFGTVYTIDMHMKQSAILDTVNKCDLLVFTGGEDVSPEYYGHNNLASYCSGIRDMFEFDVMTLKQNIKRIGICRGSQLLNVAAGGTMIQHANGHAGHHSMKLRNGKCIKINSTHHQICVPFSESRVLGWSEHKLSDEYVYDGILPEPVIETEVVYHPHIQALGFQYHPEGMAPDSDGVLYFNEMVNTLLKNEL